MWYGSENEVIAEVKTDTDNRTAYKRFATYDGAGRLVMEEIFGYDEEFEKRTMYTYAPGGVLTAIATTGPQRRKLNTEKLTYNSHGQTGGTTSLPTITEKNDHSVLLSLQ